MPITHVKRTPVGSPLVSNYNEHSHEPLTPLPQNAFANSNDGSVSPNNGSSPTNANLSPMPSITMSSYSSPFDPVSNQPYNQSNPHYSERASVDYYGGTISTYLNQSPTSPHPLSEHHQLYSPDQIRKSNTNSTGLHRQDSASCDPLSRLTTDAPILEESEPYV